MLPRIVFNQDSDAVMKVYDAISNSKYANMVRSTTENLKPIHGDDGTADRRSCVENFCVNVSRILRSQRQDIHENSKSFAGSIIKALRI
jgi:hypothetical protein